MSRTRTQRKSRPLSSVLAKGEPMIWLTSGSLLVCLFMITGLLGLILCAGLSTFWPHAITRFSLDDGALYMGEVTRSETYEDGDEGERSRRLVRTGNFRLTNTHFQWVDDDRVAEESHPPWAVMVERLEWGHFYGYPEAFALLVKFVEDQVDVLSLIEQLEPRHGGEMQALIRRTEDGQAAEFLVPADRLGEEEGRIVAVAEVVQGAREAWDFYEKYHGEVRNRWQEGRSLERHDMGDLCRLEERARLEMREAELDLERGRREDPRTRAACEEAKQHYEETRTRAREALALLKQRIDGLNEQNSRYCLVMVTAGEGHSAPIRKFLRLDEIVRAYPANQLSFMDKLGIYGARWWEYLTDDPREANSEGGVFPALFGTVLMTLFMALAVVPFGVLAALYLREYAKAGAVVSAVRIAVNNLAGVPSIVFGVFGLGFFCYGVGGWIDTGPDFVIPAPTWFLVLGITVFFALAGFFMWIKSVARPGRAVTRGRVVMRCASFMTWTVCTLAFLVLVATTPFFDGFYRAYQPSPVFAKGGLLWASLTLALMTLPVVIVATEEALTAVPNSMREGSYACGASKWQTIQRIVLPRALPGIMTGAILAMARGAGEVAPLMLVGAVKMAPDLPIAASPPFGMNLSFMHLGFHIYDVGFQSQNSEAGKPMVFTTTLLLIALIATLNLFAVWLRSRLRRRFSGGYF